MKKLLSGTFEQVEPTISDSYVENSLETIEEFGIGRALAFIILFVGMASYGLYGMNVYMGNHMHEAVGGLDVNNEFIPFLSSIWYINLQVLPLIILIFSTIWFKQTNRIKGNLFYHILFTLFMFFFGVFLFKMFQLMVTYFIVRLLYTILFIGSFIYSLWKSHQNTMEMIYGTKKERAFIVEWVSKHSTTILTIMGIVGSAYFVGKAVFEPGANLERRIIGSMVDFLPLISVASNFAFIYFFGLIMRGFYLHKYTEKFRLKFEYDKEDWYGPEYDEYKKVK